MGFSKEQYWQERRAEQEFRKQWYEWRNNAIELYGIKYVTANKQFFTQRAFKEYLDMMLKLEKEQEAAQEPLYAEAPPPVLEKPELAVDQLEIRNSTVIETEIAPGHSE